MEQEEDPHSQHLEVVWAKVKGYPWWPARLGHNLEGIDKHHKYRVDFFGEASHSMVAGSMVHPFRAKYEDYSSTKSKKLLLAAAFEKELLLTRQQTQEQPCDDQAVEQSPPPAINVEVAIEQPSNPSMEHICRVQQPELPKGQTSESKKESDNLESVSSLKRLKSDRKMSEMEEEMHCHYKPNRHKTIRKLEKGFSSGGSGGFVVPYRRYYDQKYEVRIIELLNKAHLNKPCENDILRLVKRLDQLDKKHLFNKFIISGIATLIKLLSQKQNPTPLTAETVTALEQKLFQLKGQVIISLADTKEIEGEFQDCSEEMEEVDSPSSMLLKLQDDEHKKIFIQHVYRILRSRNTESSVARGESMKIFGVIESLLKRKKVEKLREILMDLCQNEVDLQKIEAKAAEEDSESGGDNQ